MRIGIIVDGQAEYRSLPKILERIECPHLVVKTLYADIQPFAPVAQIVKAVNSRMPALQVKNVDHVLVLVDRESRKVCPGEWAKEIERALDRGCSQSHSCSFAVVIKESCYENWLISDVNALLKMRKRFSLSKQTIRAIQPNKADRQDAQDILKKAAQGAAYSKIQDSMRLMSVAEPLSVAANSRSFRRLMRQLENEQYANQSKRPIRID